MDVLPLQCWRLEEYEQNTSFRTTRQLTVTEIWDTWISINLLHSFFEACALQPTNNINQDACVWYFHHANRRPSSCFWLWISFELTDFFFTNEDNIISSIYLNNMSIFRNERISWVTCSTIACGCYANERVCISSYPVIIMVCLVF